MNSYQEKKKRLVVFFDGTWNRADQHSSDGKPCPTNITKLFESVNESDDNGICQIIHYVQGVGTKIGERITGGGFGFGISDNIKEGYKFLVSNYNPGDEIFIFGFSRGAFSARSLAGLINNMGILRRNKLALIDTAYKKYRDRKPQWHPSGESSVDFRKKNTWGNEKIKFLGVFDTVGALGAPFGFIFSKIIALLFKCYFHDTQLSQIIENAYHAVAIDEKRVPFQPTLMTPNKTHNHTNFEQRWFSGVHSDVGGGYELTGLSDITLEWMADKAVLCGLKLNLNFISETKVKPDIRTPISVSQNLLYRILTVLMIKLPGILGFVVSSYKNILTDIKWNGDYDRKIIDKGNIYNYIGKNKTDDYSDYCSPIDLSAARKINLCSDYKPDNIL